MEDVILINEFYVEFLYEKKKSNFQGKVKGRQPRPLDRPTKW